jgi:hypothetical protein
MESFKLSLLGILIPCVLLATSLVGAKEELATGDDELRTFIVHVQAQEEHVFATPDDRTAWYRSFLPEDGRLVHAYHHVASGSRSGSSTRCPSRQASSRRSRTRSVSC